MHLRAASIDDAAAIASIHVDTWRTTYSGIVPEAYLAKLSYKQRQSSWVQMLSSATKNNHFIYVVEDKSGQAIAFADGGLERTNNSIYQGELYAIYVLAAYQRQGIGRCLTLAIVERLHQLGIFSLLIWVLAANPACRFYQVLGGKKVYDKQIEISGFVLDEVAYGWTDTRIFFPSP